MPCNELFAPDLADKESEMDERVRGAFGRATAGCASRKEQATLPRMLASLHCSKVFGTWLIGSNLCFTSLLYR